MKILKVSRERWLNELFLPENRFVFDLVGFPFNFEARPGWQITPSRIEAHLVYFCRNGVFRATAGTKELSVSAGEIVWIQPGTQFSFRLPPGKSASFMRFRMSLQNPNGIEMALNAPYVLLPESVAARPWLDLIQPLRAVSPPWSQFGLRAAVMGFFASAFGAEEEQARDGNPHIRRLSSVQIGQLEALIEERGLVRTTVPTLAARLRLSHDYFTRLFLATFQCSARQWLIEQRVRAAAQRLAESSLSVSEVAEEYGYSSVYFFCRQFRAVMDTTPTSYRHHVRSKNEVQR